jgi:N-methylhydantoinase A
MTLDVDAAANAIQTIARPLGLSVEEAAFGVVTIIDNRMADLIRATTVRRGLDPRDFVLFAYGGAGPCHVGGYGGELGCDALVPLGNAASVWSALGIAQADVARVAERTILERFPGDPDQINVILNELQAQAVDQMAEQGVNRADVVVQREADIRYKGQVYELPIELPNTQITAETLNDLGTRFIERYQEVYGKGAGFRGASLELVTLRVRNTGSLLGESTRTDSVPTVARHDASPDGTRPVFWDAGRGFEATPTYGADAVVPGAVIRGPAVVDLADTTVCVHPTQLLSVDAIGNLWIHSSAGTEA